VTRDEIIALIVAKAHEHGIEPWELLGGAIAESNLDPNAYRDGPWPDKSPGLFQQTIKFADEGDHTDSPENIALIKHLYFDPVHATDVAAKKYLYWRHDPDVPPLTAWVAYNSPGFYHTPDESPNVENYRAGLAEARRILGAMPMPTPKVTFDRDFPATIQDDDWSCAPSSLDWALRALGRAPGHSYIENLLLKDGIVSRELGLLDASGSDLATWIGKKLPADVYYGADGFYGNNQAAVSYQAVAEEIGPYPLLIGGRNWGGPGRGHWSGVRGYDRARDVLLLANPAGSGPTFGGQEMTRAQFDQRGPYSMVRVLHPDLLAPVAPPAPEPPPPPESLPSTPSTAPQDDPRALIAEIRARLDRLERAL
jgi:hypothetical protein